MATYENSIRLKGFIGNHAQVKNDSHGKEFVILSLCTKSSYRNRQTDELVTSTDWHRLVALGPVVELAKTLVRRDYVLAVALFAEKVTDSMTPAPARDSEAPRLRHTHLVDVDRCARGDAPPSSPSLPLLPRFSVCHPLIG